MLERESLLSTYLYILYTVKWHEDNYYHHYHLLPIVGWHRGGRESEDHKVEQKSPIVPLTIYFLIKSLNYFLIKLLHINMIATHVR